MLGTLAKAVIWLLLATTIVVLGWEEPLRYLFMSDAERVREERVFFPPPKKSSAIFPHWDMRPGSNPLASPAVRDGKKAPEGGLKTHHL